jgi:hypothetical protein
VLQVEKARGIEEGVEEAFISPHPEKRVVAGLRPRVSGLGPEILGKISESPAFQGQHPKS